MKEEAIKFLSTRVPFVLGRSKAFTKEELVKLLVGFRAQGRNYTIEEIKEIQEQAYDAGYAAGLGDGTINIER